MVPKALLMLDVYKYRGLVLSVCSLVWGNLPPPKVSCSQDWPHTYYAAKDYDFLILLHVQFPESQDDRHAQYLIQGEILHHSLLSRRNTTLHPYY